MCLGGGEAARPQRCTGTCEHLGRLQRLRSTRAHVTHAGQDPDPHGWHPHTLGDDGHAGAKDGRPLCNGRMQKLYAQRHNWLHASPTHGWWVGGRRRLVLVRGGVPPLVAHRRGAPAWHHGRTRVVVQAGDDVLRQHARGRASVALQARPVIDVRGVPAGSRNRRRHHRHDARHTGRGQHAGCWRWLCATCMPTLCVTDTSHMSYLMIPN